MVKIIPEEIWGQSVSLFLKHCGGCEGMFGTLCCWFSSPPLHVWCFEGICWSFWRWQLSLRMQGLTAKAIKCNCKILIGNVDWQSDWFGGKDKGWMLICCSQKTDKSLNSYMSREYCGVLGQAPMWASTACGELSEKTKINVTIKSAISTQYL